MTENVFTIWQLLWQSLNVGVLLALVVMGCRLAYLLWPRRKDVQTEAAPEAALGDIIRRHRTRCRMTQEFVAESLGVSRQAVSKWEGGASAPSTANLLALAKLFQVDAAEMLRGVKGAQP